MNCACGQPLWAPKSIDRGHCEYCEKLPAEYRGAMAGLRTFPYTFPEGYKPPDRRKSGDEPNLYGYTPTWKRKTA